MKKRILSLLTFSMLCMTAAWADGYRVGFDTSLDVSNTARRINSVKINDEVASLEADNKMYRDLHETVVFEVLPGTTLTPGFVLNGGGWMHGLVYVDLNQNGDFATYDGDDFTLDEGENVANSAAAGNIGSTFSCASFTAPSQVGDYRMRFKVDWNGSDPRALNPAGRIGNNGTYGSGDDNSIVKNSGSIVDVTLRVVDKSIHTITFQFDGAATGSMTAEVMDGAMPVLPVAIPSYVASTVTPALAAATADATYTITTTYNESMPFEPNGGKNYNLNINRSPNLKVYTEGEAIKTVAGTLVTNQNQDNFKWQFEGDWLNGFALKNKAAAKYVTFGSADPANKYTATLTESPAAGAYYDLVISGAMNYLKLHGTTVNAYISNNGGTGTTFLTNWNSANNIGDGGAQFLIAEAQDVPVYDWAAYEALYNQVKALNFGDYVGQYADLQVEGYEEGFYISTLLGYLDSDMEEKNEEYYDTDMEDMQWILNHLQLNMPTANTFMRIKTSTAWIETPTYMSNKLSTVNSARLAFTQDAAEIAGPETIWMWDGQYMTNYSNGLTASNNSNFMGIARYPKTTAVGFQAAIAGDKLGRYNVRFTTGTRFNYTNKNLYTDAGGNPNADGYNFELEPVLTLPVTISAAGYATLYVPVALEIPSGVTAYTLAENGEYLKATQLEDIIPANTGVLLEGEAGTYEFEITTGGSGVSCLSGTTYAIATPASGVYTLANGEDGIGFYKYTGADVAGFKSYYVKAAEARGFGISFGGEETGIENVGAGSNDNTSLYNIAGQRVLKGAKGILIVGGRKVLF